MAQDSPAASRWDAFDGPIKGLKVHDAIPMNKRLVWVQSTATVGAALAILQEHNFQSLPCVRITEKGEKRVVGVVDVMDLVLFFVSLLYGKSKTPSDISTVQAFLSSTVDKAVTIGRSWHLRDNPLLETNAHVTSADPLEKLCNLMWGGWHRVSVTDAAETSVETFVSQFDVVHFMAQNMNLVLGTAVLKKPVGELFPPSNRVTSARLDEVTFDVMMRLIQHKVSSCPVVDASGVLFGTFSCSDLRHVPLDSYQDFELPLNAFLKKYAMKNMIYPFPANRPGIEALASAQHFCRADDSFETILYKVVALHTHRLWMIDESGKVTGVIALGDLMKVFIFGAL